MGDLRGRAIHGVIRHLRRPNGRNADQLTFATKVRREFLVPLSEHPSTFQLSRGLGGGRAGLKELVFWVVLDLGFCAARSRILH
jgi:hypothetical protein